MGERLRVRSAAGKEPRTGARSAAGTPRLGGHLRAAAASDCALSRGLSLLLSALIITGAPLRTSATARKLLRRHRGAGDSRFPAEPLGAQPVPLEVRAPLRGCRGSVPPPGSVPRAVRRPEPTRRRYENGRSRRRSRRCRAVPRYPRSVSLSRDGRSCARSGLSSAPSAAAGGSRRFAQLSLILCPEATRPLRAMKAERGALRAGSCPQPGAARCGDGSGSSGAPQPGAISSPLRHRNELLGGSLRAGGGALYSPHCGSSAPGEGWGGGKKRDKKKRKKRESSPRGGAAERCGRAGPGPSRRGAGGKRRRSPRRKLAK